MPRFKNKNTGVVVDVSDEAAKNLGSEWQSADAPKSRGRSRKSDAGEE